MCKEETLINSVEQYLSAIRSHKKSYFTESNLLAIKGFPDDRRIAYKVPKAWYRGQSQDYELLPKVYRNSYRETTMLLEARQRAKLLPGMPAWKERVDWYFMLQHHGFPTRLIDWTENPLVALYFAVEHYRKKELADKFEPIVWLIHPNAFNWVLLGSSIIHNTGEGLVIRSPGRPRIKPYAIDNIRAPWTGEQPPGKPEPVALTGGYVHPRMFVQKSKFTVHGSEKKGLRKYFESSGLSEKGFSKSFRINKEKARTILHELAELGTSRSSLFPDLDGISIEIDEMYRRQPQSVEESSNNS